MNDQDFYDDWNTPRIKDENSLISIYKSANKILWQLLNYYEEDIERLENEVRKLKFENAELKRLKVIE